MKQKITSLFIAITLLLLTTSCNTQHSEITSDESKKNDEIYDIFTAHAVTYNVQLDGELETNILKNSHPKISIESSTEEFDTSNKIQIKLGKYESDANYVSKKTYTDGTVVNIYSNEDDNATYTQVENSDVFTVVSMSRTPLTSYPETVTSEKDLTNRVSEYLSKYIDISSIKDYSYHCTTNLYVISDNGAWNEAKNGFYIPATENEEIKNYTIAYVLYSGGYETADSIIVKCDETGNIISLQNYNYGVDWSRAKFDESKIKKSIDDYLNKYLNSGYTLKEYEIVSKKIIYSQNSIKLSIVIDVKVDNDGTVIAVKCPLQISPTLVK